MLLCNPTILAGPPDIRQSFVECSGHIEPMAKRVSLRMGLLSVATRRMVRLSTAAFVTRDVIMYVERRLPKSC